MYHLLVILGPTASGKTKLASEMAYRWKTEIISADSRQVYKGMDIGTGKDPEAYHVNGIDIPVHLIDRLEAGEQYHVKAFQEDFQVAFDLITQQNKVPILCGGTGMYIEAVLQQYTHTSIPANPSLRADLEAKSIEELRDLFHMEAKVLHFGEISTKKRLIRAMEISQYLALYPLEITPKLALSHLTIGLNLPLEERRQRITARLYQRLELGMVEEVRGLLEKGLQPEKLLFYGLEYKFITQYLIGEMGYEEMAEKLNIAIHQYAKRQMTYFRHMERNGTPIHWVDAMQPIQAIADEIGKIWSQ